MYGYSIDSTKFKSLDLVNHEGPGGDLTVIEPTIRLDVRYAGTDNFMSTPFYRSPRAFMQRPAADAQVVAWLHSHPPLELVHSRLSKLAVEGHEGSFYLESSPVPEDPEAPARGYAFARTDLERYAKRRDSLFG